MLTDEQLDWICERIPDPARSPLGGRPPADKRWVVAGRFWILDNGAQQLGRFNGLYDCFCYLPLLGFLSVDDHAEQWAFPPRSEAEMGLFYARLRSGMARQV